MKKLPKSVFLLFRGGSGRVGTFIALWKIIELNENKQRINIGEIIWNLQQRRPHMFKSKVRYIIYPSLQIVHDFCTSLFQSCWSYANKVCIIIQKKCFII